MILSWDSVYSANPWCYFLMFYNGSHTLIWRVILLHNERTTLKIDSYTTWNMISSIVNVHICFTIILAKRQSSVNTVYLKKDIVGGPLIMWLYDYGCICTYYLLALLNLRKGSYFIISGNNCQSAYRTLQNESRTLMGGVILWCIEMIPGILICRWMITPTHHALRPDRKGMYANPVLGVILWYFEMIWECLSDSNTTSYTVSLIVNVYISHVILWTKRGILW